MDRRLLMAHQDMPDLVLLKQCVINMQHRAARVAEYVFNPLFLQTADSDFRAGQFHHKHSITNTLDLSPKRPHKIKVGNVLVNLSIWFQAI
jgi:hypothetical protein